MTSSAASPPYIWFWFFCISYLFILFYEFWGHSYHYCFFLSFLPDNTKFCLTQDLDDFFSLSSQAVSSPNLVNKPQFLCSFVAITGKDEWRIVQKTLEIGHNTHADIKYSGGVPPLSLYLSLALSRSNFYVSEAYSTQWKGVCCIWDKETCYTEIVR